LDVEGGSLGSEIKIVARVVGKSPVGFGDESVYFLGSDVGVEAHLVIKLNVKGGPLGSKVEFVLGVVGQGSVGFGDQSMNFFGSDVGIELKQGLVNIFLRVVCGVVLRVVQVLEGFDLLGFLGVESSSLSRSRFDISGLESVRLGNQSVHFFGLLVCVELG